MTMALEKQNRRMVGFRETLERASKDSIGPDARIVEGVEVVVLFFGLRAGLATLETALNDSFRLLFQIGGRARFLVFAHDSR